MRRDSTLSSFNFLMSQKWAYPSVEIVTHYCPVFVICHWKWVTGSLCDFSTCEVAVGSLPFLASQIAITPLAQPPPITSVSLWLKLMFVTGEGEFNTTSGSLGLLKSQMYEHVFIFSGVCWNLLIAYEAAILEGLSACQESSLTLLLQIPGGSLH